MKNLRFSCKLRTLLLGPLARKISFVFLGTQLLSVREEHLYSFDELFTDNKEKSTHAGAFSLHAIGAQQLFVAGGDQYFLPIRIIAEIIDRE